MEDKHVEVRLEHIKDLQFKVSFDSVGFNMIIDKPDPIGSNEGPNPSKILSAAIGNRLSENLIFCLKRHRLKSMALKQTSKLKLPV